MNNPTKRSSVLVCALGAMMMSSAVLAATSGASADAQREYQRQVAECKSGSSTEDRATCMKEAGAALYESGRGGLTSGSQSQYDQNRVARCQGLPAADQSDCMKRMQMGTTQGSVSGGGVIREYRETVPAMPAR